MKPKTKAVTEQIMSAIVDSYKVVDIDSGDSTPTMISDDEYMFHSDQWLDYKEDGRPIGRFIYTVTVKGTFVPFNEDD